LLLAGWIALQIMEGMSPARRVRRDFLDKNPKACNRKRLDRPRLIAGLDLSHAPDQAAFG
jgi:hypothetical protein